MISFEWTPEMEARHKAKTDGLRERAGHRLAKERAKLPRLTKTQAGLILEMMVDAYLAGEAESDNFFCQLEHERTVQLSRRGVLARRQRSKRFEIIRSFEDAARHRKDVSIEQLAQEHRVSRATVYRALAMAGAKPSGKPPAK